MHALNPSVTYAWLYAIKSVLYLPQGIRLVSLILGSILIVKVQLGAFLIF